MGKVLLRQKLRLEPSVRRWFAASLVVLIVNWGLLLAFVIPRLGELDFFRLHYTSEFGVDWIDRWFYLFTFPALGLFFCLINSWLALHLQTRYRGLAGQVAQATFLAQITLLAAGVMAILLNG